MKYGKGQQVYFLGIGGIGMSALARYFHLQGALVSGYDKTRTKLTAELEAEGIKVHYTDDIRMIPANPDLVIFTPAIPSNLNELQYIQQQGFQLLKRAEVLGLLTQSYPTIAVAGTHGKTTITSMIAHVLHESRIPVTAFIGGIANNFGSNLIVHQNSTFMVVEADEYDRSFLNLHPEIAVISSMDADHLDVYEHHDRLKENFVNFAAGRKTGGKLVYRNGLALQDLPDTITYGFEEGSTHRAENIQVEKGQFSFDWVLKNNQSMTITLQVPGRHNIENALAAAAVSIEVGLPPKVIANALNSYTGVWRRFDIRVRNNRHIFIDDYAHHPEELRAFISGVRELFPNLPVTGIFQPHLFSRTRDFMEEFAESLGLLDTLILLEIYPARELPISGVDSNALLKLCPNKEKSLISKEEVLEEIEKIRPPLLLTMGAGDIDQFVEPLQKMISTW